MPASAPKTTPVSFETDPSRYRHWKLAFDGPVATLSMDVQEDAGLVPDYRLKLNSYDLGVDIELADAIQRIRFEHPEVRVVVVTSLKERVFCAGANIFMLRGSSHAWKVNFCKFTNETRLAMEDASAHSGIKFLAALNGICAGGGYELALACDEIILVDDSNSAVSLPETPLLGVLPIRDDVNLYKGPPEAFKLGEGAHSSVRRPALIQIRHPSLHQFMEADDRRSDIVRRNLLQPCDEPDENQFSVLQAQKWGWHVENMGQTMDAGKRILDTVLTTLRSSIPCFRAILASVQRAAYRCSTLWRSHNDQMLFAQF